MKIKLFVKKDETDSKENISNENVNVLSKDEANLVTPKGTPKQRKKMMKKVTTKQPLFDTTEPALQVAETVANQVENQDHFDETNQTAVETAVTHLAPFVPLKNHYTLVQVEMSRLLGPPLKFRTWRRTTELTKTPYVPIIIPPHPQFSFLGDQDDSNISSALRTHSSLPIPNSPMQQSSSIWTFVGGQWTLSLRVEMKAPRYLCPFSLLVLISHTRTRGQALRCYLKQHPNQLDRVQRLLARHGGGIFPCNHVFDDVQAFKRHWREHFRTARGRSYHAAIVQRARRLGLNAASEQIGLALRWCGPGEEIVDSMFPTIAHRYSTDACEVWLTGNEGDSPCLLHVVHAIEDEKEVLSPVNDQEDLSVGPLPILDTSDEDDLNAPARKQKCFDDESRQDSFMHDNV